MSAKHLRLSWWQISLSPPPVDKTTKHFAFHREGVDTFSSVLGVVKDPSPCRRPGVGGATGEPSRLLSRTCFISWPAWWPCCEVAWQDGCRWASSSQLASESGARTETWSNVGTAARERGSWKLLPRVANLGPYHDLIGFFESRFNSDSNILNLNSNFLIQKTYTVHTAC